ncbi:MAG: zinc-dependent metalloprotease [Bacteroidetes bacterium]|nr:zinc-dependent metalloprotease [Bacteroidota bacterium]
MPRFSIGFSVIFNFQPIMRNFLSILIAWAVLCFVAQAATEQPSVRFAQASGILSFVPSSKAERNLQIDSRYNRVVSLKTESAASVFFAPEKTLVIGDFPIGIKKSATIQLHRAEQISDAQTLWYFNNQIRLAPKAVMYSGFIQGEDGSKVRLCMVNDRMYGVISRADGETTTIAPDDSYDKSSGEHILASNEDPRIAALGAKFNCETDKYAQPDLNADQKPFAMPTGTNLLEVQVGVEVDAPIFKKFLGRNNNDEDKAYSAAQAYIYALFAMSSSIYEDEANVTLTLPFVKMWMDYNEIGYPGYNQYGGDVGEILSAAADKWSRITNKSGTYKRDLLHVCTSDATGMAGGVAYTGYPAYTGAVCSQNLGYGVSSLYINATLPVVAYIWDVMVITHEMGHNFRSPHTHTCQGNIWPNNKPLDTCVTKSVIGDACYGASVKARLPWNKGTIMSYCHLLDANNGSVLEFRPIVAAVIRDGAERAALLGCVTEPANPVIKLQYPLGKNIIRGGKYDTIRWTSAKVNTVRVEYSDNSGQSWTKIGGVTPAVNRRMPWLVPLNASGQYLVRVLDASNSAVGDSSWVNFSIAAPSVTLQYPVGGERIGQREKPTVFWSSQLIDTVKVEFSSDGGTTWDIVSESETGNSLAWNVPDIETSQAVIRVTALSDGKIVSQSGNFAVGKEKLQIIKRELLNKLCRKQTGTIEWMYDFISPSTMAHVAISTDGGVSWTRLTNALGKNIANGAFDGWNVPDVITSNALLRIYLRNDAAVADTANAVIADCSVNSVNEVANSWKSVTLEAMPNPAADQIIVRVNLAASVSDAELYLADISGRRIKLFGKFTNLPHGEHSLHFDLGDVVQGAYFLTMKSGSHSAVAPLRIVR